MTIYIKTLKPSKPIISSKIKTTLIKKDSRDDDALENRTHGRAIQILPAEESSSNLTDELRSDLPPQIFRETRDYNDQNGFMVLKRASPVYDSEDNIDSNSIHTKRQRLSQETKVLQWNNQLQETDEIRSDIPPQIFRETRDYNDQNGFMTLKRASPVYDSDDNEDSNSIPTKRQRLSQETKVLQWNNQLQKTSTGSYSIR